MNVRVVRFGFLLTTLSACASSEPRRYGASLDAALGAPSANIIYAAPSPSAALSWQAVADTSGGYPKPVSSVAGGGIHVPASLAVTLHADDVIQSATTGQWGYVVSTADSTSLPAIAPNAVTLGLPAPVALTGDWYAATDAGVVVDAGIADVGAPDVGVPVHDAGLGLEGGHATPF